MATTPSITFLHLSDIHFGRHHRFGNLAIGDPDAQFDTVLARLRDDLDLLQRNEGVQPQVIIASGDFAEVGLRSEFADAARFLTDLSHCLKLPRRNIVVVPGNHDISRKYCESYFNECEAEERDPAPPFARKWEPFRAFFDGLYEHEPHITFTVEHPWTFWEFSDLRLVVAGLNSTIHESHRATDHHGWIGEDQARWFAEHLRPYRQRGWLRLGVVHHNIERGAVRDDENLQDRQLFTSRLGPLLNLVLHGHTHDSQISWMDASLPVLSAGSVALADEARPDQVPNQYQVLRIEPGCIRRWGRRYDPSLLSWIGDTRLSPGRDDWRVVNEVAFRSVHDTFPAKEGSTARPAARSKDDDSPAPHEPGPQRHDFLARVSEICALRRGGDRKAVAIQEIRDDVDHQYLRVHEADGDIAHTFPVGVAETGITADMIEEFCRIVFEPFYWSLDPNLACEIVYGGDARASDALIDEAAARNVHLRSFVEFQGIIDFRGYRERQAARLHADVIYPPGLYIAQQLEYEVGAERRVAGDAVAQLRGSEGDRG